MRVKRKAARLVMPGLSIREGDDSAAEYHRLRREIVDDGVGGCIVFGGNVDSLAEMLDALQEESPHPLLVGSDLERGLGQQVEGGTLFPSQMALGAGGHSGLAFAQGCVTAAEARAVGINLVFAPVADVDTEPDNPIIGVRSYGGDESAVATMTSAFIRGCQQGGAGATAKHFPGHGATTSDSHIELPVVDLPRELLERRDLEPFRAAIDSGVAAVMTAHVAYPALGADLAPATFSSEIVGGLLRSTLGHRGLVVTDALLMGAVTETLGQGEAAVAAVEAGADVLLAPADTGALIAGIEEAVRSGRMSESRLDESIARIDSFLSWVGASGDRARPYAELESHEAPLPRCHVPPGGDRRAWGDLSHDEISLEIARNAITLVRDDAMVPVVARNRSALVVAMRDGKEAANPLWLTSGIEIHVADAEVIVLDGEPGTDELQRLLDRARAADVCIAAVFDEVGAWKGRAVPEEWMRAVFSRMSRATGRTIVLGFTTPHAAQMFADAASYICCYDGTPHSQTAAVEALFGETPIRGRLPVAVSPDYPLGHGLSRG